MKTKTEGTLMRFVPEQFELQRVPLRAVLITAAASVATAAGGMAYGFPLWGWVLAALLPWLPLFFFEAAWKYEHYGFYSLMAVFVILQVGHLGEHTVQILQLFWTDGSLAHSHGVFGALDRELVHFVWDSLVWLGVIALLIKLGPHNKWLWISLVAASFHEVEHVFLFYLDRFEPAFYNAGGTTGIMAKGGLIGSPAQRPYLHFVYNFLVVAPLIMAFWDETKRAYNLYLARAFPSLSLREKTSTTADLEKVCYEDNELVFRQGEASDHFYIVAEGEVEVVRESDAGEEHVADLGQGHFFGEMGLLTGEPRMATVRAKGKVELLALDHDEFLLLVTRSKGGAADVDSEVHERLVDLRDRGIEIGQLDPDDVPVATGANGGNGPTVPNGGNGRRRRRARPLVAKRRS